MNVLLINLTRLGDQLQSQAAVHSLAFGPHGDQDNSVCLVCLPNFAESGKLLRGVALVYPLARDGWLAELDSAWPGSLLRMLEWKKELLERFRPDLVCNLSPTVPARLLASFLADGKPVRGFGLDECGYGLTSPWGAFLQGASMSRRLSPYNVADLFRAVAGGSTGSAGDYRLANPDGDTSFGMRAMLHEEAGRAGATAMNGLVGLQLGASAEIRRWPVRSFVRVGDYLYRELGVLPVLLGSAGESALAGEYAAVASYPFLNLVGRTSVAELAAALGCMDLLISNDTGTMHLASGLGCPVLGIFLATAQAWDTGPCLEGCVSLEPDLDCHPCSFGMVCPDSGSRCKKAISPGLVGALAQAMLAGASKGDLHDAVRLSRAQARVWLGKRDFYGFVDLESLSGHELDFRTLWFREQRLFLRQFLDRERGSFRPALAAGAAGTRLAAEDRAMLTAELAALASRLDLLLELGEMLCRNQAQVLRERFLRAESVLSLNLRQSAHFAALGHLWQVEMGEAGSSLDSTLACASDYKALFHALLRRYAAP